MFVRHLPLTVTSAEICGWLTEWGLSYTSVHILRDLLGQSRGVAFVRVWDEKDIEPIVSALNGAVIGDCTLLAERAKER